MDMNTEEKEQRVFKNNGKLFEEDLRASFSKHIWTYRPPDTGGGMMARFTQESLCDLMAYNTKTKDFILMELKSTLGTSVNFRTYEECMNYEKQKQEFEDWVSSLTAEERKKEKENIKQRRKEIKLLYKSTNQAMIKYHQIKNLLESKQKYGIESYILFTFFRNTKTYAIPIENFVEDFWKLTDKKSINMKDLDDLVKKGKAYAIPQQYIRRTMRSQYDVDFLVEGRKS